MGGRVCASTRSPTSSRSRFAFATHRTRSPLRQQERGLVVGPEVFGAGVVGSAEEKEELILLVGNTPGVAKVEDAIKVRPEGGAEVAAPTPKFYTVKSGDTLSSIAQSELGDSARYTEIFNANRNILSNPDAIDVGQTLRIPQ